jgi:hypothetical protein
MVLEINRRSQNGETLTSTRLINRLWRCPSIDVNARSRDCHATDALRAISVWKLNMKTKWVCIQLACSWRPRAFEEARHRNIQAKFYNEKFPLVYESESIGDSLYEKHGATLKHKCGKRIVTLPLLSFSLIFLFFLFLFLFLGLFWPLFFLFFFFSSLGQCSNNDDHITSIYLQLKNYNSILEQNMTLYECLW